MSARRLWSLDEFLALDDGTDTRYELFDGRIVAMAPASDVHGALVTRLARRLGNALRPGREVIAEAGILPPERADSWYQADLTVTCAGLTGRQFVAEPILIVEVLSPSTAATDRERKLPDYRTIPSLQDILVVSSTEPRIEHFSRAPEDWKGPRPVRGRYGSSSGARCHPRPGRSVRRYHDPPRDEGWAPRPGHKGGHFPDVETVGDRSRDTPSLWSSGRTWIPSGRSVRGDRSRRALALSCQPGLNTEFLEPLQLSASALARALGVPRNRLTAILNGRRAVTADTALRLSIYFGTSPEFWLSLQASYDLKRTRHAIGERLRREITPRAA